MNRDRRARLGRTAAIAALTPLLLCGTESGLIDGHGLGSAPLARAAAAPLSVRADAAAAVRRGGSSRFEDSLDVSTFQRGNLHTHSSKSDGHNPPRDVYAWYRDHGYAFVALTDHNVRTPPDLYRNLERKGFVIIPGEEITTSAHGVPVHVNALCTTHAVDKGTTNLDAFPSTRDALRWAVDQALAQGAVALVNHPNFLHAFTAEELPAAKGAQLLEMWSGHPAVHGEGDEERPAEEAIWDTALSRGETFAGVAVDDTHYLVAGRRSKWPSRPGRGWVEVFAAEPTERAICDALAHGRLYSSTGVSLRRIRVTDDRLTVWPTRAAEVSFVGEQGELLQKSNASAGGAATYRLTGNESYVRARIVAPDGKKAWTQAYRAAN